MVRLDLNPRSTVKRSMERTRDPGARPVEVDIDYRGANMVLGREDDARLAGDPAPC
jgi:hypothetical protein